MTIDFNPEIHLKGKTIEIAGQDVHLNPELLLFNEANLSEWLEKCAVWYNYYGERLAEAEAAEKDADLKHEVKYSEVFRRYKEEGNSDKLSDAYAKSQVEVEILKQKALDARLNVKYLQQYLRAWDKAHDAAQNRGHTIRKEMDKLGGNLEKRVEEFLQKD